MASMDGAEIRPSKILPISEPNGGVSIQTLKNITGSRLRIYMLSSGKNQALLLSHVISVITIYPLPPGNFLEILTLKEITSMKIQNQGQMELAVVFMRCLIIKEKFWLVFSFK